MTTIKYMISLLVHGLSRNIFLWAKFSNYTYLWLPPALIKNILTKNIELNINKTSKLKNSIYIGEDKDAIHVCLTKLIISKYSEFSMKIHFSFL